MTHTHCGLIPLNTLVGFSLLFFFSGGCALSESNQGGNPETASATDADTATEKDGDTGTGRPSSSCVETIPLESPTPCEEVGIAIQPPWNEDYECDNLGPIPDVPPEWGGLTLHPDNPNILLIGGDSNEVNGALYALGITRDKDCHITGFSGIPATKFSSAAYNDGGIVFGPGGVLFLARWPENEISQILPGSTVEDKIIDLTPFNVTSSPGGLNFVPAGFSGAHNLKLVSWPSGDWYTVNLTEDVNGTYDIQEVVRNTTIPGGPEGFVYIKGSNEGFSVDSLLVAEWSDDKIATYESDTGGNPLPETRKDFVSGLNGAEGAFIDPKSGDFLFITWGGAEVLIAIRGFQPAVVM